MAEEVENEGPKVRLVDHKTESKVDQERRFLQEKEEADRAAEQASIDAAANADKIDDTVIPDTVIPEIKELKDEDVLSHIKNKYGREVKTVEELFEVKTEREELDSEVAAFNKFRKETGRGIEDYVKINRDLDKVDQKELLIDYYKSVEDLDDEEIAYKMKKFAVDEELDTEDEITEKKLALKSEQKKAKKHAESLREQYKAPLESRDSFIPEDLKAEFEEFKANKTVKEQGLEEQAKRSKFFADKTGELFSDKFEGFGFNIDENTKISYKPADAQTLKSNQSSLDKFVGSFLDDKGYLKDAELFHKAIAIASDPDGFAKFVYDKAKADAITEFEKENKNIDMTRSTPGAISQQGPKVRILNDNNPTQVKYRKT